MNTKVRLQLSAMMFGEFFIWGAWFVTMWRYLSALKFDGVQIGAAYSTTAWAAIISPFFVGMIADRFFSAEKVLGLLHLIGAGALYYVSTITDSASFFWVLLLYTLCYMPTLALVNAISFNQMTDPGQEFPYIRVLGTIGWIVAGVLVGFMPECISGLKTIEDTNIPMKIAAGASVIMGLYSFFLPNTPPKTTGQRVAISDVLGLKSLKLMKEPSFAVFVICSFLICIPLSFYYQSANGFLGEIGIKNAAAKMTMGQMSEIFFMLVMPFFFVRLGVKKMLLVGMLFWVGRYFLFAWGGGEGVTSIMIYLGILFHGICYDFFFVTGQIYVDEKAPADIRAGAQGFIAFVTLGIGMLIGNYVNGWVTKHYTILDEAGKAAGHNWHQIWLIPAIMAVVVAVFFVFLFKENDLAAKEAHNG
jgi:nucleoside transporter